MTLKDAIRLISHEHPTAILSDGAQDFTPDGLLDTLQDTQESEALSQEVDARLDVFGRFVVLAVRPDGYLDNGEPMYRERVA